MYSELCRVVWLRAYQMKPDGIIVSVYNFDRALMAPLSRKCLQLHEALYSTMILAASDPSEKRAWERKSDMDWPIGLGCVNHDVQNALKWSLSLLSSLPDVLKRMLVAISSVRNSYDSRLFAGPCCTSSMHGSLDRLDNCESIAPYICGSCFCLKRPSIRIVVLRRVLSVAKQPSIACCVFRISLIYQLSPCSFARQSPKQFPRSLCLETWAVSARGFMQ